MRILHVKSFTSIILILYNFPLPPNQTLRTHYQEVSQAFLQAAVYFPVRVYNHACREQQQIREYKPHSFKAGLRRAFLRKSHPLLEISRVSQTSVSLASNPIEAEEKGNSYL